MFRNKLYSMLHFDSAATASAAPVAAATETPTSDTPATDTDNIVDGVDLTKLTVADLEKLAPEEVEEAYKTIRAYINAKAAAEWAEIKAKVATWAVRVNRVAVWVAIAGIGAKLFGLI